MNEQIPSARVHVLLARQAAYGVVIRRGPSKAVCTIGWNRRTDDFEIGQWLRGRIYERRCDLSPAGRHLIYFAMDGRWSGELKGSWTAISRVPHLKAVGLWAKGDCWNGGGLFLNDSTYWLNDPMHNHETRQRPSGLRAASEPPFSEDYGGECPGVYYHRLQRDGWTLRDARHKDCCLFEKDLPHGWTLVKCAHATTIDHPEGRGCYFDTHRLIHPGQGAVLDRLNWEWADLDRNRLVWIEKGILYAAKISPEGVEPGQILKDFNPMKFETIAAPY